MVITMAKLRMAHASRLGFIRNNKSPTNNFNVYLGQSYLLPPIRLPRGYICHRHPLVAPSSRWQPGKHLATPWVWGLAGGGNTRCGNMQLTQFLICTVNVKEGKITKFSLKKNNFFGEQFWLKFNSMSWTWIFLKTIAKVLQYVIMYGLTVLEKWNFDNRDQIKVLLIWENFCKHLGVRVSVKKLK